MIIGLLEVSISIPDARSIKDKRAVLRSVKDRTQHRINVSVAEVGMQDEWRRAELAFVTVAATTEVVDKRLAEVRTQLSMDPSFVVMDFRMQIL